MDFRCLHEAFNGGTPCKEACDTCARIAGKKINNLPRKGKRVLILYRSVISIGIWNGTCWHIHDNGIERYLHRVDGWLPLPQDKDFYQNTTKQK